MGQQHFRVSFDEPDLILPGLQISHRKNERCLHMQPFSYGAHGFFTANYAKIRIRRVRNYAHFLRGNVVGAQDGIA